MIELAIAFFQEESMTSEETQDAIERTFMAARSARQKCHGLWRSGLDLVGNSEFRDGANGSTERCAKDDSG